MKTKLFLFAAMLVMLASCGSDDESSATIYYKAICSEIKFDNPAHEEYRAKIIAALQGIQLIDDTSYFVETASAPTVAEAAARCDDAAQVTYRSRISSLSLLVLKQTVYNMNKEEFVAKGIGSFVDLPFSNLTITFRLINSQSAQVVKEYPVSL